MNKDNISAIILAAGFSSRMERFKPLLRVGEKTLAEHAIALFKNAGIGDIVTVVGHLSGKVNSQPPKGGGFKPWDACKAS